MTSLHDSQPDPDPFLIEQYWKGISNLSSVATSESDTHSPRWKWKISRLSGRIALSGCTCSSRSTKEQKSPSTRYACVGTRKQATTSSSGSRESQLPSFIMKKKCQVYRGASAGLTSLPVSVNRNCTSTLAAAGC